MSEAQGAGRGGHGRWKSGARHGPPARHLPENSLSPQSRAMVKMPLPRPRAGSVMSATASLRVRTPSRRKAEKRWLLTVLSATHELVGDLPVRVAHHDEREDLLLARGERRALDGGPERRPTGRAGPRERREHGGHHELGDVLVEEHRVGALGDRSRAPRPRSRPAARATIAFGSAQAVLQRREPLGRRVAHDDRRRRAALLAAGPRARARARGPAPRRGRRAPAHAPGRPARAGPRWRRRLR